MVGDDDVDHADRVDMAGSTCFAISLFSIVFRQTTLSQ